MMVMSIESDQKGTLVIQHSSISDEGIYQCIAMNAFGKAVSPETRLKAAGKPCNELNCNEIEPLYL